MMKLSCYIARLNKVSKVSTESTILGMPSSLPIFVSPAALARLGHPDGEMNLVRAAGKAGILQGVCHKIENSKRLMDVYRRSLITRVARLRRSCRSSKQDSTS